MLILKDKKTTAAE